MTRRFLLALGAIAVPLAAHAAGKPPTCRVESGAQVPMLVELYTSEGCSSCPPADRWLSALKARSDVVALGFHVHYWDRLGWTDRLGDAAFSQRQVQQQRVNGARFAYTPQVVIDGRDEPAWRGARWPASRPASTLQVQLARDTDGYRATVQPLGGAPARLAGFWAVTEDSHVSRVSAGENSGATLRHDFVVRETRALAAWPAPQPATLRFVPSTPADGNHPRRVNLVLVDADTGRPVQALAIGC